MFSMSTGNLPFAVMLMPDEVTGLAENHQILIFVFVVENRIQLQVAVVVGGSVVPQVMNLQRIPRFFEATTQEAFTMSSKYTSPSVMPVGCLEVVFISKSFWIDESG